MIGGRPARAIRQTVRQRIGRRSPAGVAQPDPVAAQRLDDGLPGPQPAGRRPPPRPGHSAGRSAAAGCAGPARPGSGPGTGRTRRAGWAGWRGGAPRSRRRSDVVAGVPDPPGQLDALVGVPERLRPALGVVERGPPDGDAPSQMFIAGLLRPGRRPGSGASSGAARSGRPGRRPAAGSARAADRRRTAAAIRASTSSVGQTRRRRRGRTAGRRGPAALRHCGRPGMPLVLRQRTALHPGRQARPARQPLPTTTTSRSTSRWASSDAQAPVAGRPAGCPWSAPPTPKRGSLRGAVIAAGTRPAPPPGGRPR